MRTMLPALQAMMRLMPPAAGMVCFLGGLLLLLFPADASHFGMVPRIGLGVPLMIYGFFRLMQGARKRADFT